MTERVWQLLLDSFSQILVPGLLVTIPLTILSFTFGLLIAIGTALVQIAQIPILKQVARFYIWVVRGTPLLVQLYVIFFGLPSLGIVLDAFPSAVLVFSVNTGAYAAETIRASIESVPKGAVGGWLFCRDEFCSDHASDYSPTGLSSGLPALVQYFDWIGQGYIAGCQYYRFGDVYGNSADCSKDLRTVCPLL